MCIRDRPYNVARLDDTRSRLSMAVAGFGEDDLEIEARGDRLTIRGTQETDAQSVVYRGIASGNFERHFRLADNVQITGAQLDNGLLHIDFELQVPEAEKPRRIGIGKRLKAA